MIGQVRVAKRFRPHKIGAKIFRKKIGGKSSGKAHVLLKPC
jgi:hypothetical protein